MIRFFRKLWQDSRGNALMIAAAAMPLMIGSAGLASDTIQWVLWKRELQRAADSAAMAGVYAEVGGGTVGTCTNLTTPTSADAVAYDISKVRSHIDPQSDSNLACAIKNPPDTGTYSTDSEAVRVSLTMSRQLSFTSLFLKTPPVISAVATATVVPGGQYCVVSLENQNTIGIDATGSTKVNLGCGMITNSTSMTAAVSTGNASVTATPIAAVGGIPSSDNWGTGTVLQPFTLAESDPFGSVPLPTPTNCGAFPSNQNKDTITVSNPTGVRCFNSTMNINGNVTLAPGTYIVDAGSGVNMTNTGAKLSCSGCTIILENSSGGTVGGVTLTGGTLNMTAEGTGCTIGNAGCYDGMLFYQSRNAASGNSIKINGNSGSFIQGAFYFPKAQFTFNGDSNMSANCMQVVAKDVVFTGNSTITNNCPAVPGLGAFTGRKVRLVA